MTEHDHGDEDLREADFEHDCPMCGESLRPGYSSRERSAHCAGKRCSCTTTGGVSRKRGA